MKGFISLVVSAGFVPVIFRHSGIAISTVEHYDDADGPPTLQKEVPPPYIII
jgi:hypothetical protein